MKFLFSFLLLLSLHSNAQRFNGDYFSFHGKFTSGMSEYSERAPFRIALFSSIGRQCLSINGSMYILILYEQEKAFNGTVYSFKGIDSEGHKLDVAALYRKGSLVQMAIAHQDQALLLYIENKTLL